MPARIPLRGGWATKRDTTRIWNDTDLRRRKRLIAIELIWDADSMFTRTRLAELAGVSRRQLHRWITAFNEGGLDQLLYPPRRPLGRKRKISPEDFNNKVFPLVQGKVNGGILWSVAGVQQELAAEFKIHVGVSTLCRYLAGSGFRPSLRKPKLQEEAQWNLPWPQEYCRSLADYLAQTGQRI